MTEPAPAEATQWATSGNPGPGSGATPLLGSDAPTITELVEAHFDFIWRSLRRMGLSEADADDATQEVFVIASRRLDTIGSNKERSFLFGAALRVASLTRRTQRRYQGRLDAVAADPVEHPPSPEELLSQREARADLDVVLDTLDLELRAVFVLFELEELSVPEIAELLEVKVGTVSSRLRRAREQFSGAVKRLNARRAFSSQGEKS